MRTLRRGLVALMLAAPACIAQASEDALESACKARIATTFREWTVASVTPDVSQWAKSQQLNPTLVYGDFDGDGHLDLALLVQDRSSPILDYPERAHASHVAICLSKLMAHTIITNPIARFDTPASCERAFTVAELRALAESAGLEQFSIHRHRMFRMALIGRK